MIEPKQHEKALFEAARNLLDPAARRSFLDQACLGNPGLRARLDGLLAALTPAGKFFDGSAPFRIPPPEKDPTTSTATPATTTTTTGDASLEGPGASIGRYKLLQRIGEGGCGVVYMAEQREPVRRRVALKVIRLGMDTESVIARFEAERQALAMMDHPNIARVLEAGATENGRPYFVMELVRGVKITEYCDQNHLDTRRRLDLFIQICQAIQHAHQKGIIHRDIKPSNILVTLHDGVPVPKVIDFGIAKATEGRLTDRTLFTAYEQFIGTPAYMSPEQAEMSGLDIDTRSDIYSLGVLLYELLTGKTPFDSKELVKSGLNEMRKTLREREPHRPSTMLTTLQGEELTLTAHHRELEPPNLISLLRGDLDWIVMKALEKDRTRRYETANGLAMDIKRYLHNEPVVARPPSRRYRFQKLVRRNRGVFIATGAVAAALIAGLGTSTWMFVREREARANESELRRQAEARTRITQATLLVSQEKYAEAEGLLGKGTPIQPTVECSTALRSLGEWHALEGRWRAAADRFGQLLQVDEIDGWDVYTLDYLRCGPALIELGDLPGYEHFRRTAIARFSGTSYPVADRIVKISLLLPADREVVDSLQELVDVTIKTVNPGGVEANEDSFRAAWQSVSLALTEYRRNNYPKAVDWCRRCLSYSEYNAPRVATAHVILAMSCYQLHRLGEAHAELAEGRKVIEAKFNSGLDRGSGPSGFWFDWMFARILLREATALMEGTASSANAVPKTN